MPECGVDLANEKLPRVRSPSALCNHLPKRRNYSAAAEEFDAALFTGRICR